MFSLASLLAPRPPMRIYALLDQAGVCRAFRRSAQAPLGAGWVEVDRECLAWLHKPLPGSARISTRNTASRLGKALSA